MKLQISEGERIKKGKKRLANVIYINATKKLGLPRILKLFVMRLSRIACKIVNNSVIKTLVAGENVVRFPSPSRLPKAGSKITESRFSGRCRKTPRHSTNPMSARKSMLIGVYFLN